MGWIYSQVIQSSVARYKVSFSRYKNIVVKIKVKVLRPVQQVLSI